MADNLLATGGEENGRPKHGKGLLHLSIQDIQSKHRVQVVAVYRYQHNIPVSKISAAGFKFQGYIK
jgi:hypothetical protein